MVPGEGKQTLEATLLIGRALAFDSKRQQAVEAKQFTTRAKNKEHQKRYYCTTAVLVYYFTITVVLLY